MRDTFFDVPDDKAPRVGTNHRFNAESGKLEVLPVPAYPLRKDTTFFSGGGGLVSTAEDYPASRRCCAPAEYPTAGACCRRRRWSS